MVDLEWGRAIYVILFWSVLGMSQFHICDWSKRDFAASAQVRSNLFLLQKSDLRSKKFLFLKYFFLYLVLATLCLCCFAQVSLAGVSQVTLHYCGCFSLQWLLLLQSTGDS